MGVPIRAGTLGAQLDHFVKRAAPHIGRAASTELEDVLADIAREVAWGWQQND